MPEGVTDNQDAATTAEHDIDSIVGMLEEAESALDSSSSPAPAGASGDPAVPQGGAPAAPATSGATGQPATAATPAQDPKGQPKAGATPQTPAATDGPVPLDRHKAAVANARAEVEARYSWAKDYTEQHVKAIPVSLDLLRELRTDPLDFYNRLTVDLQQRGLLKADHTAPTGAPPPEAPKPDLVAEDKRTRVYSADAAQKLVAFEVSRAVQQVKQELTGQIQPLMQAHQDNLTAAQRAEQERQGANKAAVAMAEFRKLEHFTEANEPKIMEELRALPEGFRKMLGPIAAVNYAYSLFLQKHVFPTISQQAEERVRQANQKKLGASIGAVNPGQTPSDLKPRKLETEDDLAAHMGRLAAAAS